MSSGALLDGPAPRRRAALPPLGVAAAWRRVRPALLVALPLVLAAAALWFAVSGWSAARDDDRIAALERAAAPFARRVFQLAGRFDAQALTRHLMTT